MMLALAVSALLAVPVVKPPLDQNGKAKSGICVSVPGSSGTNGQRLCPGNANLSATGIRSMTVGAQLYSDTSNPVLASDIETSLIVVGNTCHVWYRTGGPTTDLYHRTATDPECRTYGSGSVVLTGITYPYVWRYGSTFYLAAEKNTTGDLYMWSSPDGTTWTIMNGGTAVLSHSAVTTNWLYTLDNPAIAQVGNTLYLMIEAQKSTGNPSCLFASTTTDTLNFNTNITSTSPPIAKCGNPHLTYVPDRGALLMLYGDQNGPGGLWRVLAATGLLTADLSQTASWVAAPNWTTQAVSGIHIADPAIAFDTGKSWPTIYQHNYNQGTTYQFYSGYSLTQFYDLITAADATIGTFAADTLGGSFRGGTVPIGSSDTRNIRLRGGAQSGTTNASRFDMDLFDDSGTLQQSTIFCLGNSSQKCGTKGPFVPDNDNGSSAINGYYTGNTGAVTGASVTAGACAQQGSSITVTGAAAGNACFVGLGADPVDGLDYKCRVTANTCKVYACNPTAGNLTSLSATHTCSVFK